jgi:hypothetical protein
MPESISGQRGHDRLWDVAVALLRGFALSEQEAWPLLLEFSDRCRPPWPDRELRHKIEDVQTKSKLPVGYLLSREGAVSPGFGGTVPGPLSPSPEYSLPGLPITCPRTETIRQKNRGISLRKMYKLARRKPLVLARGVGRGQMRTRLGELARLCQLLQQRAGGHPFGLGVKQAGKLFGVAHQCAGRWVRILVRAGILQVAERYKRPRGRKGRTTRYRFMGVKIEGT